MIKKQKDKQKLFNLINLLKNNLKEEEIQTIKILKQISTIFQKNKKKKLIKLKIKKIKIIK